MKYKSNSRHMSKHGSIWMTPVLLILKPTSCICVAATPGTSAPKMECATASSSSRRRFATTLRTHRPTMVFPMPTRCLLAEESCPPRTRFTRPRLRPAKPCKSTPNALDGAHFVPSTDCKWREGKWRLHYRIYVYTIKCGCQLRLSQEREECTRAGHSV